MDYQQKQQKQNKNINKTQTQTQPVQKKQNPGPRRRRTYNTRRRFPPNTTLVTDPVATSYITQNSVPLFSGQTNPPVSFRELVCGIDGSQNFVIDTYSLNPGNAELFPWLSKMATNFEYYQFTKLKFMYIPSCSTVATGTVYMAMTWDVVTQEPTSDTNLAMYATSSNAVRVANTYEIKGPEMKKERYVISGETGKDKTDPRLYFMGKFWIATKGTADTSAIGQLWVEYTVTFRNPVKNDNDTTDVQSHKFSAESLWSLGTRFTEFIGPGLEFTKNLINFYGDLRSMVGSQAKRLYPKLSFPTNITDLGGHNFIEFKKPGQYLIVDMIAGDTSLRQFSRLWFNWDMVDRNYGTVTQLFAGPDSTEEVPTYKNVQAAYIVNVLRPGALICQVGLDDFHIRYARLFITETVYSTDPYHYHFELNKNRTIMKDKELESIKQSK